MIFWYNPTRQFYTSFGSSSCTFVHAYTCSFNALAHVNIGQIGFVCHSQFFSQVLYGQLYQFRIHHCVVYFSVIIDITNVINMQYIIHVHVYV